MILNKKKIKPADKMESIFEMEARLRLEAIEIAKNHIDKKPIKYLLK